MGMEREKNYTLEVIDLSDDTQVNSGGASITNSLQPPVGFVYEILSISYNAPDPSGSGSGTHQMTLTNLGMTYFEVYLKANFGNGVTINGSGFTANAGEIPSALAQQYEMTHKWLYASNSIPLNINYKNDTDVNQTGTRSCKVLVKKYREAI